MNEVDARVALPGGAAILGIRMGEVDRFLVPLDDAAIIAWFFSHLFVAHNLRERLFALSMSAAGVPRGGANGFSRCWTLESPLAGRDSLPGPDPRDGGWASILERTGAAAAHAVDVLGHPRLEAHPSRCIFLRDYHGSARDTVVVFVFPHGARRPAAVVKVRPAVGNPTPLREEWLALSRTRRRLPPALRGRVPKPLGFETIAGQDVLAMSALAGRSAYVELYQGLEPARCVARHFQAAADWLAHFHEATRIPHRSYRPEHDEALNELLAAEPRGSGWHDRLLELTARRPVPLCAGHGDFWARNLVLPHAVVSPALNAAGVVDFEHGSPEASPFHDLLQFPLTYGLDYPWSRFRRRRLPEAFRLTFLERNCVSAAVRQYFADYCSRSALDKALLLPAAHVQLLARAHQAPAHQRAQWLACQHLLQRAEASVFSF